MARIFLALQSSATFLFSKEQLCVYVGQAATHSNPIGSFILDFLKERERERNDNLMTYGSGLEFSWRGFRFCNTFGYFFFFFFVLFFILVPLRSFWFDSASTYYYLARKQLMLYFPFHSLSLLFIYFILFCFYFLRFSFFWCSSLSDLLVLETPPGQRAERFSAPLWVGHATAAHSKWADASSAQRRRIAYTHTMSVSRHPKMKEKKYSYLTFYLTVVIVSDYT